MFSCSILSRTSTRVLRQSTNQSGAIVARFFSSSNSSSSVSSYCPLFTPTNTALTSTSPSHSSPFLSLSKSIRKNQLRAFSSSSSKEITEKIGQLVKDDPVVLFMKGTPEAPLCGFSNAVVRVLAAEGAKYAAYNVLEDEELRHGIKDFSSWPTIPQLYVKGEFIGGCDITLDLFRKGELTEILRGAGAVSSEKAATTPSPQ